MTDEQRQEILEALNKTLTRLLAGETVDCPEFETSLEPRLAALCETVNRLAVSFKEVRDFIHALAQGNLDVPAPPRNLLASPFKELQASLLHLTWQTGQIAAGDYSQHVHFMGDFSTAFNKMVEALEEKRRTENLLREAQARVKHLEGIIPICMYCKKIRDDKAMWQQMEKYITEHSEAFFSHGICPECHEKVKSDLAKFKESRHLTGTE